MNGETKSVHAAPASRDLFKIDFVKFGRITVSLPLFSLIFCFFSAIIFQFEAVNETVCNVRNTVPSISAITGVTPQRYIWRVCIALHCAPRFAIGFIYWYYYMQRTVYIAPSQVSLYQWLVRFAFWVYTIENACLVGVTYVANVENYPIHEKIFVGFMVSSIVYELLVLIIFRWCHPQMKSQPLIASSYRIKKVCFVLILLFTAGLLYNFFRHRWYCEPGAFTFFSAFEYGIAIVNIAFHFTATKEFQHMSWTFGSVLNQPNNNHHKLN
jgi:post-GPI attachment to proteins factor 2